MAKRFTKEIDALNELVRLVDLFVKARLPAHLVDPKECARKPDWCYEHEKPGHPNYTPPRRKVEELEEEDNGHPGVLPVSSTEE